MKMPVNVVRRWTVAALCLLAASGLARAATVSFPPSGMGRQSGATIMGDKSAPTKVPDYSMGIDTTVTQPDPGSTGKPTHKNNGNKLVRHKFHNAWFKNEPSIAAGENAIENDFLRKVCSRTGGSYRITNIRFNPFTYFRTSYGGVRPDEYSAMDISGVFVCDLGE